MNTVLFASRQIGANPFQRDYSLLFGPLRLKTEERIIHCTVLYTAIISTAVLEDRVRLFIVWN